MWAFAQLFSRQYCYGVLLCVFLGWVVLLFAHPVWLYWWQDVPLGYDPGLYKLMVTAFDAVMHIQPLSWWLLPWWIQTMYEPMLGVVYTIRASFWGSAAQSLLPDRMVLFGIWWFVVFVVGALWVYTRSLVEKPVWLWLWAVAMSSFVLYQLYRWWYFKQLLASALLLCGFGIMLRKSTIPYLVAGLLCLLAASVTHRPAIIVVIVGVMIWFVLNRKQEYRRALLLCVLVMIWWVVAWYGSLLEFQFRPIIDEIVQYITLRHTPGHYWGTGTFLTIRDYMLTNVTIALWWVIWTVLMLRGRSSRAHRFHASMLVVLLVWIWFEWFFFQRMIGYIELFFIPWWVYLLDYCWRRKQSWLYRCVVVVVVWQFGLNAYWQQHVRFPLIEKTEFDFIRTINDRIEHPATIVVPWIYYSPWIAWWTNASVIAPWLFDRNQRWDATQWRATYRRSAPGDEKCLALYEYYYKNRAKQAMYVRVWSKQEATPMDGFCFEELVRYIWWYFTFYRVVFDAE
jgi:hypothetical protein